MDTTTAESLLETKDIAKLYEAWTCFALIEAVEAALGRPVKVRRPSVSDLEAKVDWELQARWANGTTLHFNPCFTRGSTKFRSYSEPLRPDLMLTVPTGASAGRHIFDAKFKLKSFVVSESGDGPGVGATFKREDLHKMHAYRDALTGVRSAWVLYPGTEMGFFPLTGRPARAVADLEGPFDGVGGIPLTPAREPRELAALIARLCDGTVSAGACLPPSSDLLEAVSA